MNQQDRRSARSCGNVVQSGSVYFGMMVPNTCLCGTPSTACMSFPLDNLVVSTE